MADERTLEAVEASNRELRERIRELERQLLQRDTDPGRLLATVGNAPLADQLDTMLAFEPVTLYVLDRGGALVHITGRGVKPDTLRGLLGQSAFDQVHSDSRDEFRHRLDQVLALGEPLEFEVKAREDDEGARWYRTYLRPWRSTGSIIGAIAVFAAIDDERHARIENKRFRALLDQASEAIFVVDPRTARFLDVNTRACQQLDYTRAELLDMGPSDIAPDDLDLVDDEGSRGRWHDHLIEIMAEGTLVRETLCRRKDGSTFPVEETVRVQPFEGDEYLLMVCRDLTEAKRIKEELRKAEETLRVSDRLTTVGTLAAGVAHEINNPLAYVMGNIEFATDQIQEIAPSLSEPVRKEILECLEEARHGASRMSRIVRDLRTFSRQDEESVAPVDLNEVLDSSINIAMNEIRPRAQLDCHYTDDLLVIANESRVGQVFLNLVINAAQAIAPGDSKNQRITIRTTRRGEHAVVAICDTGKGMTPDVAARIFEPFFTTKPLGVGTGLGLAICQNIVETMDGRITVDTRPGHGTTFEVELPAATETAVRANRAAHVKRTSGKVGRILIIDDDERAAKALRRVLHVHDVTIETDGRVGLEQAENKHFDLIFCDMMMPDFGGIEFYESLSQRDRAKAERVVFVTGGTFTPRAREFLENTDNDFVSKPYDAPQVRRMATNRLR